MPFPHLYVTHPLDDTDQLVLDNFLVIHFYLGSIVHYIDPRICIRIENDWPRGCLLH